MPAKDPQRKAPAPKKSLGQNFLIDANVARKIVAALNLRPGDRVLEIGPGRGALTRWIVEAGPERFVALEKDEVLAGRLAETWPEIEVRAVDALKFDWAGLPPGFKLVGNLPYNVASRLIWDLALAFDRFERAVFMVQHEVGLRLTVAPGNRDYGALGAWTRGFAQARYLFRVPPTVFRPRPRVDSAVVSLRPLGPAERPVDPQAYARLIRLCFQHRRKQIRGVLGSGFSPEMAHWLASRGFDPEVRAERLGPDEFKGLLFFL
ncbi:MAG: ribosomal RNA small subunit methyltransferase A [Desulfovibrionaceae bacterium]|nr:ribosomal RNA small subunit methyltransferase A [Desulfovibrionaceae bacterium]